MGPARWLVVVVLAALACAACGSSRRFDGSAATPAVRADFIAFNSQARRSAEAQGRTPQPAIIVSKAHGVLHVATSDGSINLWAAPKMGGGTCSYVVWDPERNDGGLPADATIISLAARDDHGRILGSSRVR